MITYDELQAKAERYARHDLTCGQRDDVLALLNDAYIEGFKQGYSVAGGIANTQEAADAVKESE